MHARIVRAACRTIAALCFGVTAAALAQSPALNPAAADSAKAQQQRQLTQAPPA